MSIVKYSVINHSKTFESNPKQDLSSIYPADMLFIEPIGYIKYLRTIDKRDSGYIQCPAFTDFFKNTFVLLSPVDISITYDTKEQSINVSGERGINQEFYDNFVEGRLSQTGGADRLLMTLDLLRLYFITKDPVSFEILPNFVLYNTNKNYNVIPGKFRIDKWIRPIEFAFEFIDDNKPIVIKRGDPLFTIRFTPEDDSKVELEREIIEDIKLLRHVITNHTSLKSFLPKLPLKAAYEIAKPFIKLFWKQKDKNDRY